MGIVVGSVPALLGSTQVDLAGAFNVTAAEYSGALTGDAASARREMCAALERLDDRVAWAVAVAAAAKGYADVVASYTMLFQAGGVTVADPTVAVRQAGPDWIRTQCLPLLSGLRN